VKVIRRHPIGGCLSGGSEAPMSVRNFSNDFYKADFLVLIGIIEVCHIFQGLHSGGGKRQKLTPKRCVIKEFLINREEIVVVSM
jgi:hypothetical protein